MTRKIPSLLKKTKRLLDIQQTKFFVFSNANLDLREIKYFKTKIFGSGLLLGTVIACLVLLVHAFSGDLTGAGRDRASMLSAENRILKEQLQNLAAKVESFQGSLEQLSERGNELRLMVDLTRIDEDTRVAAIGGSTLSPDDAFLTGDAGEILSSSRSLIEKLTREVRLQQSSYEEIQKRIEYNRSFFSRLPAIKPMAGYYSVNGFGMRVHPVLHVYRMHEGIDIINDVGTNVYAAGDGVVRFSGRTAGGYGVVIEINHGYGYASLYAHLEKVIVRPGRTVKRGELIGKCGRSGLVSGPHLHFEVRHNGRKQNPVDYFFDDVEAARYRAQLASLTTQQQ